MNFSKGGIAMEEEILTFNQLVDKIVKLFRRYKIEREMVVSVFKNNSKWNLKYSWLVLGVKSPPEVEFPVIVIESRKRNKYTNVRKKVEIVPYTDIDIDTGEEKGTKYVPVVENLMSLKI